MSIIIKGMDMPKNCGSCPFYSVESESKCYVSRRFVEYIDLPKGRPRPLWCPLEEAPDITIVVAKQTGYPTIVVHRNPEDAYREDFGKENDNG